MVGIDMKGHIIIIVNLLVSSYSPSFVSRPLAEDGPAMDAPKADGSDASSLLLLLGGGPG